MRPLRSHHCRVASNETIADDILQERYIRFPSRSARASTSFLLSEDDSRMALEQTGVQGGTPAR